MRSKCIALAFFAALVPSMAGAQQASPPYGAAISFTAAKKAMAAAEALAMKNGWPMAIVILDSGGNIVMTERMDRAGLASIHVAEGKARLSVQFRASSKRFADLMASGQGSVLLSIPGIIAAEGGEVLISDGQVVGAIGVSGGAPNQDSETARAAVATLEKK